MFSHLELSGTVRWVIDGAIKVVGDRQALIPWVGFVIGGFLSTVGIFSTGPVAILVPIIAFISVKYRGTYLVKALGVIMGSVGLGVSPLNPTGATIRQLADRAGVDYSGWGLWLVGVVVTAVALAVLQVIFGALRRRGKVVIEAKASHVEQGEKSTQEPVRTAYAVTLLVSLAAFVVCVIFFRTDAWASRPWRSPRSSS